MSEIGEIPQPETRIDQRMTMVNRLNSNPPGELYSVFGEIGLGKDQIEAIAASFPKPQTGRQFIASEIKEARAEIARAISLSKAKPKDPKTAREMPVLTGLILRYGQKISYLEGLREMLGDQAKRPGYNEINQGLGKFSETLLRNAIGIATSKTSSQEELARAGRFFGKYYQYRNLLRLNDAPVDFKPPDNL